MNQQLEPRPPAFGEEPTNADTTAFSLTVKTTLFTTDPDGKWKILHRSRQEMRDAYDLLSRTPETYWRANLFRLVRAQTGALHAARQWATAIDQISAAYDTYKQAAGEAAQPFTHFLRAHSPRSKAWPLPPADPVADMQEEIAEQTRVLARVARIAGVP